MTSTIVPPVDLAPGMPSRVVTVSATDVTEGGQSLEGQTVRFALSDTLDVTSGGDVIAKTQAEVVLDSNGEGSIRLPVYDEAVKTWCGQDWAILVTATWGSQKAIRVPAGTSSIALSALPPVRPLRGREKTWAVTGVGITVTVGTEAGQASGTASLNGGLLDIGLVVPPAGPHTHDDRYFTKQHIDQRLRAEAGARIAADGFEVGERVAGDAALASAIDQLDTSIDDKLQGIATAYDVAYSRDPSVGTVDAWLDSLVGPRGPEGPYGGTEVADPQVASWIGDPSTETGAKLDAAYRDGISVLEYGATGDGVANDTPAFAAAIAAADGAVVRVPAGIYAITGLVVDGVARLQLDDGATLYHPDNVTHAHMFSFSGTVLRIRGGTIDGNRTGQQGVSRIIYGDVPEGAVVDVEGVHFRSTAHSCCNVGNFGGYLNFSHNTITDQMEHQGPLGRHTTIASVGSGQAGAKGLIRTNHNRAIFDKTPRDDGTNPGGFFVAVNGYDDTDGGTSGTQGFANGNLSTWEAVGNYFYGYGQNHGGNDISPLHAYPAIAGARWVDNYFEACGFSAVSAKSVQDFVFTSNVIRDGMISPRNVSTEGAIAYLPGYQAASFSRPRAIISNNIVTNPGGSAPDNRQACLNVGGTPTSIARDIIVSGNVFTGGGYGIRLSHAADVTIIGNHVEGGTTSGTSSDTAIRVFNPSGRYKIVGNDIRSHNGNGLMISGGCDLHLSGNTWTQGASLQALYVQAVDSLTIDGDSITVPTPGLEWLLRADSAGKKIGHLHLGGMKIDNPGTTIWANVEKASGSLVGNGTPVAQGIIPAQIGTTYQQLNGGGLWVAMGLTASSWRQVIQPGAGDAAPTMTLGAAAGTGASVTVTGDGTGGQIRVTTGTAPRGWAAIGSLVFATQRGVAPSAVILTPANSPAVDYLQSVYVLHTTVTRNGFGVSCRGALQAETEYAWYYQIVD